MGEDNKMVPPQADKGMTGGSPPLGTSEGEGGALGTQYFRDALDMDDAEQLGSESKADAELDVALDETFPTSDPTSPTQPGKGTDPAPSSGYDPEAEAKLAGGQ